MPEILYGLFCEDVREEAGGKTSVLGILGSTLLLHAAPPANVRLAAHVYIHNPERIRAHFSIRLDVPGIETPFILNERLPDGPDVPAELQLPWGHNINLSFGNVPVVPGEVRLQVRILAATPVEKTFTLQVLFLGERPTLTPVG